MGKNSRLKWARRQVRELAKTQAPGEKAATAIAAYEHGILNRAQAAKLIDEEKPAEPKP